MADPTTFDDVLAFAWHGPPPGDPAAAQARLLLLDSWGCMAAGLRHPRPVALGVALATAMPGPIRLPGLDHGLSEAGAAAVLAAAMCWDEANDGHAASHGRPGLAVAPLCLAALASGRVTLAEARAAYALGYEVGARAGEVWRIRPGMHVDGAWHALGAAAAAARLAGADAATAARAIRLTACQIPFSMYAPIAAGLDGRNAYPAHAVLLGVLAAASAVAGLDAPPGGFAEAREIALAPNAPPQRSPADRWELATAYIKPYAGVRHAHYAAAAALDLRPRLAAPIAAIELATYAEALRYAGNRAPTSAITAQFSLSWAIAAALVQGDLGPAAYTEAALADPALRALEAQVVLTEDTALTAAGQRGATLRLTTAAGETLTARIDQMAGDAAAPLDAAAVAAKVHRFVADAPLVDRAIATLLDAPDSARPGNLFTPEAP